MVLDRKTGQIEHRIFKDIVNYLDENDVLVLNDTKVIPARLFGFKEDTKAHIELLMLKEMGDDVWQTLCKPARRVRVGTIVTFGDGLLKAECIKEEEDGIRYFKMIYEGIFLEILDKLGEMPLPPYIHEHLANKDRYQTVYAKNPGSAAAPTAGLHFTKEILDALKAKGVTICYITLHVGLGTFRPVSVTDVTKHKMHSEFYHISQEVADILNNDNVNVNLESKEIRETINKTINGKVEINKENQLVGKEYTLTISNLSKAIKGEDRKTLDYTEI